MKLPVSIITFLILAINVNAQLDRNSFLVGGFASFYSSKSEYTSIPNPITSGYSRQIQLSVFPNVGYFIADKFALGLRPYFSWGKGESSSANGTISTSDSKRYGIGPFARYYFLDKEKQFNLVTDISYQVGVWHLGDKGKLTNFSFLAGPVIYFNSSVGLEFLLGYSSQSEELKNFSIKSTRGFNVNIGFQIHLVEL